ncbi:MAG: hypothetical protein ACYST0_04720 [Planctomycetota bacterium]
MLQLRLLACLTIPLLVTPVFAQESRPAEAAHKKEEEKKKRTPLQRLLTAPEEYRQFALVAFIDDEIGKRTIYAGQYSGLRKLDWDVQAMLLKWLDEPPLEAEDGRAFRNACISALRDVVEGEGSAEVRATLKKIATTKYQSRPIKENATYALAQFGDTSLVDDLIAEHVKRTKDEQATNQARGWQGLAEVYKGLRKYEDAVKAYKQLFILIDSNQVTYPPQYMPVLIYNSACSMARAGHKDAAFVQVEKALKAGKESGNPLRRSLLDNDMDIQSLREDERFGPLVQKYLGAKTGR